MSPSMESTDSTVMVLSRNMGCPSISEITWRRSVESFVLLPAASLSSLPGFAARVLPVTVKPFSPGVDGVFEARTVPFVTETTVSRSL